MSNTVTLYRNGITQWTNEIECYKRLKNSNRIPNLVSYNQSNFSITTKYSGISLFEITAINKEIPDIDDPMIQLEEFINDCRQHNIVQLDMHPGNILVYERQLFFIDFENVIFDNNPVTPKDSKRYEKFVRRGAWNSIITKYEQYFKDFDNQIWFGESTLQKGIEQHGKAL